MLMAGPPAPSFAQDEPECPPGWENPGPGPGDGFDSNVSIFAGGNFAVGGEAAEAEGLVVALGNAAFERATAGTYNVGVVGVGSGISPPPGSDMLVVGGDLSGNNLTTIDVGFGIGGNVVVGGAIAPGTNLVTSGGTVTTGVADATAPYDDLPALIQQKSATWAGLTPTGTVDITSFSVTFTGDGTSNPQVFEVDASALVSATSRSIQFLGIPDGAAVYVNVTGATATLNFNALLTESGAVMDPFSDPAFVELATHLMWNFPDSTDVTIGGLAQLPGSIVVPSPASSTMVSAPGTNGRVYVGGDLLHTGTGAEMHNYPFLPDEDFDCEEPGVEVGALAIQKIVSDPDDVVPADQDFTGTFECTLDGSDVTPPDNSWSVTASGQPVEIAAGLPVGAICTLEETPPADPDPAHTWEPADIAPDQVTIVAGTAPAAFTATNTVIRDPDDGVDDGDVGPNTGAGDSTGSAGPNTGASSEGATLPFTGADLAVAAVVGLGLFLAGLLFALESRGGARERPDQSLTSPRTRP
jgi:choice-of-anchor A domain-containing protein